MNTLRDWLASTPKRTFILYPLLVVVLARMERGEHLVAQPWGAALLVWGYLQYRLTGLYRTRHGGGGPGIANPATRLVMEGPYRYTRNPMYLGHLIFMAGLAITFASWLAVALLLVNAVWFDRRVRADEARLEARFGAAYHAYRGKVSRWLPGLS